MKQFGPREAHQRTVRSWAFFGGPPVVTKQANVFVDAIARPRGHWIARCDDMPTGYRMPLSCLLTCGERRS